MEDSRQKATQSDLFRLDQVVKRMELIESVTRGRSSLPIGCLQSCTAQSVGHWPEVGLSTWNVSSPTQGISVKYTLNSEDFVREKEYNMPR